MVQARRGVQPQSRGERGGSGRGLQIVLVLAVLAGAFLYIRYRMMVGSKTASAQQNAISAVRNLVSARITFSSGAGGGRYGSLADL